MDRIREIAASASSPRRQMWRQKATYLAALAGCAASAALGFHLVSRHLEKAELRASMIERSHVFFARDAKNSWHLVSGWGEPGRFGAMTTATKAELTLRLEPKPRGDVEMAIEGQGVFPPGPAALKYVRIFANGTPVATLHFNKEHLFRDSEFTVPYEVVAGRDTLTVQFDASSGEAGQPSGAEAGGPRLVLALKGIRLRYRP